MIEMPDGYYAFATSVKNTATYAIRGSKYYVEKDTSESDAASDTGKNVGLMAQTGVIPGRGYLYPAADVKTVSSSDNGATSPRTLDDAGVWGCILVGSLATICYISNGYQQSGWWYLGSFALIAVAIGVGHTLMSARLSTKRGKDITRLFLGVSIAITIVALRFLASIPGEG